MSRLREIFGPATVLFVALTLLTGLVYPLLVTGFAQVVFPRSANGSLIERDGVAVGSEYVGQSFTEDGEFHGRPSATSRVPYDGLASTGSNLGPTNPALREAIEGRIEALGARGPVPVDLVTTSGSGLDPHISPAAARFQVERVARARGLDVARVQALVDAHTEGRTLGLFGAPRVHVLRLNLALEELAHERGAGGAVENDGG